MMNMKALLEQFDELDIDTESIYSDDTKRVETEKPRPPPTLDDFIGAVLAEPETAALEGYKEKIYEAAFGIALRVLESATGIHPLFKKYLQLKNGKPYIVDFRALDSGVFQCLVPIKRPIRPDTFKLCCKNPSEFPSHRILVKVNRALVSVDRLLISKEWGHCVDTHHVLRPDFILHWFNDGLRAAQTVLRKHRPKSAQGYKIVDLMFSEATDGTLFIYFVRKSKQYRSKIKINIVPCMVLSEIPKQYTLTNPIPSLRPFQKQHSDFTKKAHEAVEAGEKLFFLEARMIKLDRRLNYDHSVVCSWGLNMCSFEERSLNYVANLPSGQHFKDIMTLMGKIQHSHVFCLHPLTKRVLLHTMLYEHRANMPKVLKRQEWFLLLLDRLLDHLQEGTFVSFFHAREDLFSGYSRDILRFTHEELSRMLKAIKDFPNYLVVCAGYELPVKEDELLSESSIDITTSEKEETYEEIDNDEDDYTKMAEDDSSRILEDLDEDSNNTDTGSDDYARRKLTQNRPASRYSEKIEHDDSRLSLLRDDDDSSSMESWEHRLVCLLNESTITNEAKDETMSSTRELRKSADILSSRSSSSAGVFDSSTEDSFDRVFTTESSQPRSKPKAKVLTKKRPKYFDTRSDSSST